MIALEVILLLINWVNMFNKIITMVLVPSILKVKCYEIESMNIATFRSTEWHTFHALSRYCYVSISIWAENFELICTDRGKTKNKKLHLLPQIYNSQVSTMTSLSIANQQSQDFHDFLHIWSFMFYPYSTRWLTQ